MDIDAWRWKVLGYRGQLMCFKIAQRRIQFQAPFESALFVGINVQIKSFVSQLYVTVVPSSAGSSNSHLHLISLFANMSRMTFAIPSKLSVANANIVGPAPERHIPHRPG